MAKQSNSRKVIGKITREFLEYRESLGFSGSREFKDPLNFFENFSFSGKEFRNKIPVIAWNFFENFPFSGKLKIREKEKPRGKFLFDAGCVS